jgi:hypothetical protein
VVAAPAAGTIVEPLIVVEDGQVLFFEDVITVESYLEPAEVQRGAYAAYDSIGTPLSIGVATRREEGLLEMPAEYVTLAAGEPDPAGPLALQSLLVEHFVRAGGDRADLEGASLAVLVERGLTEARGTHEHGPLFFVEIGRDIARGLRSLIFRKQHSRSRAP